MVFAYAITRMVKNTLTLLWGQARQIQSHRGQAPPNLFLGANFPHSLIASQNKPNGSVGSSQQSGLFLTFLVGWFALWVEMERMDYDDDLWVVPAELDEEQKPHLVPLTAPLKEVLEQLRDRNGPLSSSQVGQVGNIPI